GSFAGLRVGVSAAKGYALASGCEIVGVSGFDAHAKDAAASAWITLDGRRGEVFMQRNGAPDSAVRVNLDDLTNFDFGSDSIHGPFAAETAAAAHLPADRATSTALAADISYIAKLGLAADAATHPATLNYMRGADAKPGAGFSLQRAG
ncbi:MAG: tRNA (adenosine(37)-N6)-threonylcarbamoyltransferase complex dimerization subunit type 1 TsaB, partial [Pseudomonadota bacterium]